jgi:hypothetical protein
MRKFTLTLTDLPNTGRALADEAAITVLVQGAVAQALAEINEGARKSGAFGSTIPNLTWEIS